MKGLIISIISLLIPVGTALADEKSTLNSGDTAWLLTSSALVMLMTVPGLALFYGGLAKKKDILNTIAMSFIAYCIVSITWIIVGYGIAYGSTIGQFFGNPFEYFFLKGMTPSTLSDNIPAVLDVMFQLVFATITVALVSGSYIERMKFSAWLIFTILWGVLVYPVVAHWVWGDGFLSAHGALDFAGGTVVHINAGIAGLVGALMLGKRKDPSLIPNNVTLVALGAGLLWFGWFGFNAGSAYAADGAAAYAMLNTNIATAAAAIGWMLVEWMHAGKPTVVGISSGIIAGLVAITPAAGFVNVVGAIIIGVIAGVCSYYAVAVVKQKLGYDDALDVFGIHGVSGIIGAILTGVFADPSIGGEDAVGLLYGNPGQVVTQIIGVIATIIYSGVMTAVIIFIAKALTGLRVKPDAEEEGLDQSEHGEKAYNI